MTRSALRFVVDVPTGGTSLERHPDYDLYRRASDVLPLPVVVIVPGPAPAAPAIRPRSWPVYRGYCDLIARRGIAAIVVDLPYHDVADRLEATVDLARVVEAVRTRGDVDGARIAIWAFSGGALLVERWLSESPSWLRCLALTYPLLGPADNVIPGRPVVLTRVGWERPDRQAAIDALLARMAGAVQVIDVPHGQHGFDVLDHTQESRDAVLAAVDAVAGHLAQSR